MADSFNMKEFSSTAIITENGIYPSTISINTINTKCKEDEVEKAYDPFENRKLEHPNSDVRSFANLLKSSLGSGILAMPAAFKNAGTIVGIFGKDFTRSFKGVTGALVRICGDCGSSFLDRTGLP